MRLLLVSMLLMLAGLRAEACPHGVVCVASETRVSAVTEVAVVGQPAVSGKRARRTTTIDLAIRADIVTFDRLSVSLRTHVAPRAGAFEMPWIWQMLRKNVYSRLPRYAGVDQFSMVLAPVVVESQQDTVPGVGVEGGF